MSSYTKYTPSTEARTELHDRLSLTGAEISINNLPAGGCVPFVHAHKENEEIYYILSGKGSAVIEDEAVELSKGDWLMIPPASRRQLYASKEEGISYICIQVKSGSLSAYTAEDPIAY